ncbi:helix-turn-helix transcriptional regulator [Streptomyces sp. NPDC007148]|uniref:helix-turn-helix transcriptional regulator n=1 Tax=Streptomyces sp. NPDC007148 TaxID=3364775 RepID=UPI0036C0186F
MSAAENISRNVRRLRRAKGWTQEDAARRMSAVSGKRVSLASWSAAERSPETGRPKAWTANEIAALAELFGVAAGDLFGDHCSKCGGEPPVGFTCNTCGAGESR